MADESYKRGFQDGWDEAVKAVMRNRDHFRMLLHLPTETHEEAMKRIYGDPKTPPRGKTEVDKTADIIADAVDLYVVLMPGVVWDKE